MTLPLDEMRKIAEEAAPGPWHEEEIRLQGTVTPFQFNILQTGVTPPLADPDEEFLIARVFTYNDQAKETAEFIAKFNPAQVLEMIAEIESLRAQDEVHWKTRQALLKQVESQAKALEEAIGTMMEIGGCAHCGELRDKCVHIDEEDISYRRRQACEWLAKYGFLNAKK